MCGGLFSQGRHTRPLKKEESEEQWQALSGHGMWCVASVSVNWAKNTIIPSSRSRSTHRRDPRDGYSASGAPSSGRRCGMGAILGSMNVLTAIATRGGRGLAEMVRAPGAISLTRSARTALSRGLHVPRALEWPAVLCELGRCGADTVAPSLEPLGTMPKVQPLGAGPRGMQIVREAGLPVALRSAWNFGPSPAVWVKSGHRAANQAAWWWRGRRADLSSPPPRGIAVRGKNPSGGRAARAFRPEASAALLRGGADGRDSDPRSGWPPSNNVD